MRKKINIFVVWYIAQNCMFLKVLRFGHNIRNWFLLGPFFFYLSWFSATICFNLHIINRLEIVNKDTKVEKSHKKFIKQTLTANIDVCQLKKWICTYILTTIYSINHYKI